MSSLRIASWNLNHRIGMTRFKPEAADAAIALGADAIFFNEYFPQRHGATFEGRLKDAGWVHQLISHEGPERHNRTMVASRVPVEMDAVELPSFDYTMPSNTLAVRIPSHKLRVVAVRVPMYQRAQKELTLRGWEWIESTAAMLADHPAMIVGDLNCAPTSRASTGGDHFRRILASGWTAAQFPQGQSSYFGPKGSRSTLDHLLHTRAVRCVEPSYVTTIGAFTLAGDGGSLSDHAAIVAELIVA